MSGPRKANYLSKMSAIKKPISYLNSNIPGMRFIDSRFEILGLHKKSSLEELESKANADTKAST